MIQLTDDERRKFAVWCAQEAASLAGLAEQMEKMGGPLASGARAYRAYRARAQAYAIVAREIDITEVQTLEKP